MDSDLTAKMSKFKSMAQIAESLRKLTEESDAKLVVPAQSLPLVTSQANQD
jgi:hypothetical protein